MEPIKPSSKQKFKGYSCVTESILGGYCGGGYLRVFYEDTEEVGTKEQSRRILRRWVPENSLGGY